MPDSFEGDTTDFAEWMAEKDIPKEMVALQLQGDRPRRRSSFESTGRLGRERRLRYPLEVHVDAEHRRHLFKRVRLAVRDDGTF